MTQRKFAVSLNDADPEEWQWIEGIDASGMIPAHVLKEALRVYFGTTREAADVVTTGDVVDAINAGFAMLADRLDNIRVAPAYQVTQDIARQDPIYTEADLDIPADTIVAIKKAARPGMRLQD